MKILIISHKSIFPPLDGGSVASKKLLSDFQNERYQTDIICLTNKETKVNENVFKVNTNFSIIKLINSFFSKKSYQAERFFLQKTAYELINIINKKKYKFIVFEGVFPAVYLSQIKKKCDCTIIIRAHNIEHEIWKDLQKNTKNILKKIIYFFIKNQIKKWEDYICNEADFFCCISNNDIQYFSKKINKNIKLLPVSFTIGKIKQNNQFSIFHLGSMDWKPNIEGINWFIDKVWSKFKKNNVSIYCYLAGKNMPDSIKKKSSNKLFIEGTIENAKNYMSNKSVMIVPIFSGSGIRIKILEGMALGIPIISTSKGAQGIPYKNGENILIANNPSEYYKLIIQIFNDKNLYTTISNGGKKLISNKFSQKTVIKNWNKIINA